MIAAIKRWLSTARPGEPNFPTVPEKIEALLTAAEILRVTASETERELCNVANQLVTAHDYQPDDPEAPPLRDCVYHGADYPETLLAIMRRKGGQR